MKRTLLVIALGLLAAVRTFGDPGPTKMVDDKNCLALIQAQLQDGGRDPADFIITFENSDTGVTQAGDLVVYNKYKVHDNETDGEAEVMVAMVIHVTATDAKPAPSPTPKKTEIGF